MSSLRSLLSMSVLAILFLCCCCSSALPVLGRFLGEQDSVVDIFSPRKTLFPRTEDVLLAESEEKSGLQTRQLADLEFTNRYAELLKSQAKVTSICSFLKRLQSSRRSGFAGDAERLVYLMKQYSCPNLYQ